MIASAGRMSIGLAERMIKDVPAHLFARKPTIETKAGPKLIDTNHPAFVYGHLSTYPVRLLPLLGAEAGTGANPPGFDDLFAAGKECRDDPSGTIYPAMEKITAHFFAAHRAAVAALEQVSDAVLAGPNPREGRSRELFPTVGAVAVFYMSGHIMNHLGQVSAWRRCVGLGPVPMG
jgi:hypothetical protein